MNGVQYVYDYATANGTVVNGNQFVSDYASATSTTINSGGTAIVSGVVTNFGTLIASGPGSLVEIVSGAVVSGGAVKIGNGIVDVLSGGTANVAFLSSGSGGLEIADTQSSPDAFTGVVSGFGGPSHNNHKQFIDLISVTSHSISLNYAGFASGTLTVLSSSIPVATIEIIGHYLQSNFSPASGISGTVAIIDPGVVNGGSVEPGPVQTCPRDGVDLPNIAFGAQTMLAYSENGTDTGGTLTVTDGRHAAAIALLGNYMAASFATAADGHGGTLVTESTQTVQPPLLTHPPHG